MRLLRETILLISIGVLLLIPLCQLLEQPNSTQVSPGLSSLNDNETAFVYSLPRDIFFEGQSYRTLWVYADGLVTFGYPAEESRYPISSDSGRIYESLGDLRGPDAIAVFVLNNERTRRSAVTARLTVPGSGATDDSARVLREYLRDTYGLNATDSVPQILQVEWLEMQPCGTGDDKNTFRLFLISTNRTTFCIVEHTDIRVSKCSRSGRQATRQSGLYSRRQNKYFPAPEGQGEKELSFNQSVNIERAISWTAALEDIPNSMNLRSVALRGEGYKVLRTKNRQQDVNVDKTAIFKKRIDEIHSKTKVLDKQDPVGSNNSKETEQNHSKSYSTIFSKGRAGRTLHASPKVQKGISKSPDLHNRTTCMSEQCTPKDHDSLRFHPNFKRFVTSSKSPAVQETSSRVTYTRPPSSMRSPMERQGIRKPVIVLESSGARTMPSIDISRLTEPECPRLPCARNEECLRSRNGSFCCHCRHGSVPRHGQCSKRVSNFAIHSKGTVQIASTEKETLILDFSLTFATRTLLNESFPRAYLTLVSRRVLDMEFRNFFFFLYPLFHIPISFYASSWSSQAVPNLDSIVTDRVRIDITIAIEHHSDISLTFQLQRTAIGHRWLTFVKGVDLKQVKQMRLENAKFDEKSSTNRYNLIYVLRNETFVEFPEQVLVFQDEEKSNREIKIKWRGKLTFGASCLSSHLGSQTYFVKFSDRRYCNSDCAVREVTEASCRLMCLGSPFVFDVLPDPCQGNFCGANKVCINRGSDYQCLCRHGLIEVQDKCVADYLSTSTSPAVDKGRVPSTPRCSLCSENANCQTVTNVECCTCKDGYIGSGRLCFDQGAQFDLSGSGSLKVTNDRLARVMESKTILLIRHLGKDANRNLQISHFEIGEIHQTRAQERRLLHWLLLLSPLFDVPLAGFARDKKASQIGNLYSLSKGVLYLNITVESNLVPDIELTLAIRERGQTLDMLLSLTGIPAEIDTISLPDTTRFFNKRRMSNVLYTIRGGKVVFPRHRIPIPSEVGYLKMWWKGTGDLHRCSNQTLEKTFIVAMRDSEYGCNARCDSRVCIPYCQAIPELQEIQLNLQCHEECHQSATCIHGVCVCRPGFSGNGIQCLAVRKNLECRTSRDCIGQPQTECRTKQCLCRPGFHMVNGICVISEKCRHCLATEVCVNEKCLCKRRLVRNRVSGQCVFDCSLCDPYSTECRDDGCVCRSGFQASLTSDTSCSWPCSSDTDCPTHETCLTSKVCYCPLFKENGICQLSYGCHGCHQKADCHENRCQCRDDWLGDGRNCSFNCSVCFDSRLCSVDGNCSCPPGFKGDGRQCSPITCQRRCPRRSRCKRQNKRFVCVCASGLIMKANKCISDSVMLSLVPPDQAVHTVEGRSLDLICSATSRRSQLFLTWTRKSGKALRAVPQFVNESRNTLKLRLESVGPEDSDLYTCSALSGHQISVNVTIGARPCKGRCDGPFSLCVEDQCQCIKGYVSDGIRCSPAPGCPTECSTNEICNKTSGRCTCLTGFVLGATRCVDDCRKTLKCHEQAQCNQLRGLCECHGPFVGNGTLCVKKEEDSNCLLTKRCVSNATCRLAERLNQYLCICDRGFVGDGHLVCHPKLDCSSHKCEAGAFCESFIVNDPLGSSHRTGRCLCEHGYVLRNGSCTKHSESQLTLWLAMGEAIIRYESVKGRARIRYIDNQRNSGKPNVITSLGRDCVAQRLVWSGDNGVNIKSSLIGRFTDTVLHESGLGKVTGLVVDDETGNIFFSDAGNGRIGLVNIERNMIRTLIHLNNYSPGPIVLHRGSQRLFWIVKDFRDPRIETSLMTGEGRSVFLSLNSHALSVAVADISNSTESFSEDRLCWIEKHHQLSSVHYRVKAVLKCAKIFDRHSSVFIEVIHEILDHEPYTTLAYNNNKFYWNVRRKNFIKVWDYRKESQLNINPKCCEAAIRVFIVTSGPCRNRNTKNPCWPRSPLMKCPQLCVPKLTWKNKLEPVCLNASYSSLPMKRSAKN